MGYSSGLSPASVGVLVLVAGALAGLAARLRGRLEALLGSRVIAPQRSRKASWSGGIARSNTAPG